ncbi:MAG: PAS domain S-box protein [Thermodesulfobacteriota bacterium]
MTNSEQFNQHLDALERSLGVLRAQAGGLPGSREALGPAFLEMTQTIAALRNHRMGDGPHQEQDSSRPEGLVSESRSSFFSKCIHKAIPELGVGDQDCKIGMGNWREREVDADEVTESQKCYQLFYHRDRPCEDCHIFSVLAGGQAQAMEQSGFRERAVSEATVSPSVNEPDQVTVAADRIHQITALKESEELYRVLTERSLAGIYLLQDNIFCYANSMMAQIFGYAPEEIINRLSPRDLVYPEDHPLLDEQIHRRLEGEVEEAHYTARGVRRDGSIIHLEFLGRRIEYRGRPAIMGTLLDITARRRAEEEQREAEQQFRSIFDNATDGILIVDLETKRFHLANPMIAQMLGYTREELQSLGVRDVHPPDSLPYVLNGLGRHASGDLGVAPNIPMLRKDGSIFYVDISASPYFKKGKLFLAGIFRDVTARKQEGESLKTQALVLESMAEAVTVVSEDGYIVSANPAAYALFEYQEGELTGQPVTVLNDLPPAENERFVREVIDHLQREGIWLGEVRNRTKSGTPFITYARVSTLELPGKKFWVCVQEDITARKHLEEATAGYLHFIRHLLETIPNPVCYQDDRGIILGCNKAFAEFVEMSQQEIPGKIMYDLFPGEVAGKFEEMVREALEHPETKILQELRLPAANGRSRRVVCHKAAFSDSSGGLGGVVSALTDVTALYQAQEAMRESEARLRAIIENAQDVIFVKDRSFKYTLANPAVGKLFNQSADCFLGLDDFDLFEKTEAVRNREEDQRVLNGETMARVNSYTILGKLSMFHMVKVPLRDESGEVTGICGIARDVTALQRAEEALRESEERYRTLFETSPFGTVLLDLDLNVIMANQQGISLFGCDSLEEVKEKKVLDFFAPEDLPRMTESMQNLPETSQVRRLEATLIKKDGTRVSCLMSASLVRDAAGEPQAIISVAQDISDLKRAEQAVRESEARLRAIFEYAPVGITMVDSAGRFLQTNPTYQEIVGFSAEELQEMTWQQLTPPEDLPRNLELQAELLAGQRQTYSLEKRYLRKDGKIVWVSIMLSRLLSAQGDPRVVGTTIDITARKLAEEALRESEQRFRDITENAMEWIWEVDAQGKYTYSSPVVEKLLGYKPEEVLGSHYYDFFSPDQREELKNAAIELLATKQPFRNFLNPNLHKNGETVMLSTSGIPVLDDRGNLVGYRGSDMDITAQKQAEEALRESEQRFRLMAETIQDVLWIAAPPNISKIIYVSPRYEAVWGRTTEELYQSPQSFLEYLHPDDRERVRSEILAYHAGRNPWSIEYRIIKPDGSVRWIQDRGFPVQNDQGNVILYTGVATDITERKVLEQQLLLSQKMEAVGRLAGGIAHDFNNLLMAIAGYGELMQAKVLKDDPLYRYLEDILKATDRAAALTGQLLTFSRKQIVYRQLVDLNQLVLEMDSMLRRLIQEDIEMKIITAPSLGAVEADPGSLNQIIMNLVINARDAMPCGGSIILKTAEVEFDTSRQTKSGMAPPGRYVVLEVSDSGIGMDETIQAHIFEPFFTTKETGKGTGLGLSTVYGIVKQSKGFIDLDSEPGQGSTFTIYLPRLNAVAAPPKMLSKPAKLLGNETILLVEDEEVLRALLAKFLRVHGYKVLEARHGGEALLLCEQHQGPIHLMVTDVVMPQMSGRVLADRLFPLRPEMKVLYMSGYTEDEIVQRGVADLSIAFIQKPFKPVDLARQVHALLHPSG